MSVRLSVKNDKKRRNESSSSPAPPAAFIAPKILESTAAFSESHNQASKQIPTSRIVFFATAMTSSTSSSVDSNKSAAPTTPPPADDDQQPTPESPVKMRNKQQQQPPPGLDKSSVDENRRRYTAVVDDTGLVHFGDGYSAAKSLKQPTKNHSVSEAVQINHLMQLLGTRLEALEEQSSSIEKVMDSYELSARSKLEDARNQLKTRVDELIEIYGLEINAEVQKRKGCLQHLERHTEEHLTTSNSLLSQAKSKMNGPKLNADELRAIHDKLLDALVKTRKIQRDASEFECWVDFIPSNPLQNDHCIGELRFQDPLTPSHQDHASSNYHHQLPYHQRLTSFTDDWVPDKSRYGFGDFGSDHHNSSNGFGGQLIQQRLDKSAFPDHQDPWNAKNLLTNQPPPGIPAPTNVAPLHFDDAMNDFNLAVAHNPSLVPEALSFRPGAWSDYPSIQKPSSAFKASVPPPPPPPPPASSTSLPVQMRGRMCFASKLSDCCEEPLQNHLIYPGKIPQLRADNKRHSLGANLSANLHPNRRSLICGSSANQKSSLLTLDMQRPIVIDCYGEQPPRHLKCIKGLTFLGPNRLIVCENGRKSGHKNVLMFSITGTFLAYCGGNYSNPTGICRIMNDGLCVVDESHIQVLSADTFQTKQIITLTDTESDLAAADKQSDVQTNALSRQDRFGGLFCTEQLLYVCDRKNPAVKVYDLRAGCHPIQTWKGNPSASTLGSQVARQSHPTLLPFSNPNFVHRKNDYIYVSDSGTNSVLILTPDGQFTGDLKSMTTSNTNSLNTNQHHQLNKPNIFNNPCGICDDGENLAVADLYNNRIQLFSRHCLIGSIYSPCIESPFSLSYHPMGILAISNGRPRTVTLYFGSTTN